jgi:hypothetical protein
MTPVMVKEAELDRIEVPEDYEVLDATALGRRLGFKRDTVLAYLSRRNFRRLPAPTASLLWSLSGTRRASESGKRRQMRRVASRGGNGERPTVPHNDGILNGMDAVNVPVEVEARIARSWGEKESTL